MKLVVRRNSAGAAHVVQADDAPVIASHPPAPPARPPACGATAGTGPQRGPSARTVAEAPHQAEVVAPMVGTVYRAPAPDAPPFVEIGSMVHKGQPLCLIEVMKLFTTIASDYDGR